MASNKLTTDISTLLQNIAADCERIGMLQTLSNFELSIRTKLAQHTLTISAANAACSRAQAAAATWYTSKH